ncbi:MAG: hypothetical protein H6744_18455 [Deltaproteobacteria bacterium]|nr:hypothetical protein [Deltaproteobacteria bacterium]
MTFEPQPDRHQPPTPPRPSIGAAWQALPVLLAVALTLPMWLHPELWGTDRFFNEIRLVALSRCTPGDGLWPRWLPDLAHGHGFPLFHYYPAGLYLLARPLAALGVDPRSALLFVLTAAFALSAWVVQGAIARRAGRLWALAAAVTWVTAPYLHVDLQVRHAWAEFLGLCFMPLALSGALDLAEGSRRPSAFLYAAGGLALTVLTHNVVALFTAGLFVSLGLGMAAPRRDHRALLRLLAAFGMALGLTAFFWVPALLDSSLVRVDQMSRGFYGMAEQSIYPRQLLGVAFGRGPSVPGPDDAMSLSVGLGVGLALLASCALALARPRRVGARQWLLLALSAALVALTLPFAAGLYDVVPLLHHAQAPFRFLGPIALLLAWTVPLVASRLLGRRLARGLAAGLILVSLGTATLYFGAIREMTPEEAGVYRPVARRGAAAIADLADPYTTTAGFLEYLPKTVVRYPTEATPMVEGPPWIRASVTGRTCGSFELAGEADRAGVLRLGAFDFPGVEVLLDGQPVAHRTDPELGFILAPVRGPGAFTMEVRHADLGSAPLGRAVSLLAALILIATGLLWLRRRRAAPPAAPGG